MNTYQCKVSLVVTVEAHSDSDAKELLEDNFGLGEGCDVEITNYEVTKFEQLS